MSKTVIDDEKDTQAFLELREKFEEARVTLQSIVAQQQASSSRQRRAAIMSQEIDGLPDDTKVYRSVGKAYFLSDKPQVMKDLERVVATTDEDMKQLKAKREHTENMLQEVEREITEIFNTATASKTS